MWKPHPSHAWPWKPRIVGSPISRCRVENHCSKHKYQEVRITGGCCGGLSHCRHQLVFDLKIESCYTQTLPTQWHFCLHLPTCKMSLTEQWIPASVSQVIDAKRTTSSHRCSWCFHKCRMGPERSALLCTELQVPCC